MSEQTTTPRDLSGLVEEGTYPASSWTVISFLHTFPAYDLSRITWVQSCAPYFPRTIALLKQLPSLRTALFSRMEPFTRVCTRIASCIAIIMTMLQCFLRIRCDVRSCILTRAGTTWRIMYFAVTSMCRYLSQRK